MKKTLILFSLIALSLSPVGISMAGEKEKMNTMDMTITYHGSPLEKAIVSVEKINGSDRKIFSERMTRSDGKVVVPLPEKATNKNCRIEVSGGYFRKGVRVIPIEHHETLSCKTGGPIG